MSRLRRIALAFAALAGLWATAAGNACAQQASASEVKATFLLRFGLFISWPEATRNADFTICTTGDAAVAKALRTLAVGERIGGRPVRMVAYDGSTADACAILFVGQQSPPLELPGPSRATLTVTDGLRGARGMIHFEVVDQRVRFHIDEASAAEHGLQISARLLNLALSVRRKDAAQ
jgi:hypothetical protein